MTEEKACPTQVGKTFGYRVEIRTSDMIWKDINVFVEGNDTVSSDQFGEYTQPILRVFSLLNHSSAMALAWDIKANYPRLARYGVRAVPFAVEYDVKAWKNEDDSIEIDPMFESHKGDE